MKTKLIQSALLVAILSWHKEDKKVFVKWFALSCNSGMTEILDWPIIGDSAKPKMESLLVKVREFCWKEDLTLCSY